MGGIATQHHAALDPTVGDCGVHLPQPNTFHLDIEIGNPDRAADPGPHPLGVPELAHPLLWRHADLAQPAAVRVEWLQQTGGLGVGDEKHDAPAFSDMAFDIGAEVAVNEMMDALLAGQGDAKLATYRAVDTIGRHQRFPGQGIGVARGVGADRHGRLGVVVAPARQHVGDLVTEPKVDDSRGLRRVTQDGFGQVLRRHDRQRRADRRPGPFETSRPDLTHLLADHRVQIPHRALPTPSPSSAH